MRQSSYSIGQLSVKFGQLSETCSARVVQFLRARHVSKTAEAVEASTGIAAATVRKWLDRASAPSFIHCLALIAAYGPEFLSAVMERAPDWVDDAARAAKREALAREIAALEHELREADRHDIG